MARKTPTVRPRWMSVFESMIFDPTLARKYIIFCSDARMVAPPEAGSVPITPAAERILKVRERKDRNRWRTKCKKGRLRFSERRSETALNATRTQSATL